MHRIFFSVLVLFLTFSNLVAQELKVKVDVNSDKIQGTNKQPFQTLQNKLTEFMNEQKWSDAKFSNNEKIEATFVLTLTEVDGENYKGELQIQAKRPVFNSSYKTTLLNLRDINVDFTFREFEPLHFNINAIESNLTAIMAFYAYYVMGVDFDSFSPLGGSPFYQQAQAIASTQLSSGASGWNPSEGKRNRGLLIKDALDESSKSYRELWYNYHRQGLDEMSNSVEKGRLKITSSLPTLKQLRSDRPMTTIIATFGDAKLDEIPEIYSKSGNAEREEIYKLLSELFPTQRNRFESLRTNQ
ncbi:MAG: DUF4835 family protein [Bacteroidales bacterium]